MQPKNRNEIGGWKMDNAPDRIKKKRIYAREEYCVNCRLCEIYCITAHSEYKNDIVKAFNKSAVRPVPRIIVEENKPISFALQCRHCEEPECVKSCITGAMQKDPETGVVTNDETRCIGCWTCILACPYGVVMRDFKHKKVASKCDYCMEAGGEPQCVSHCPNEAIYFGEAADTGRSLKGCDRK